MRFYQPHHSELIIRLENKKNQKKREDFDKKLKETNDALMGVFLGDKFNELFDNSDHINLLMEKIKAEDNRYILSLTESDCQNFTFSESPFELCRTDIDLEKPGNLWNCIFWCFLKEENIILVTQYKVLRLQ